MYIFILMPLEVIVLGKSVPMSEHQAVHPYESVQHAFPEAEEREYWHHIQ